MTPLSTPVATSAAAEAAPLTPPPRPSRDARAAWTLAVCCLLTYGWFYQGPGYNQHSHFATVRALVEHGTFEITRYADMTGDIGRLPDGRVFSNKAPGLALWSVPPYFVLYHVERLLGRDPAGDARLAVFNLYLLTVWGSALPATGCVVAIFYYLRRRSGLNPRAAMLLAAVFGFGTLAFPHSGALMAHNFVALCLFTAWMLLERDTRPALVGTSALLGVAVLTEHLTAPVVGLYLLALLLRKPSWRDVTVFCAGPAAAVGIILCYNAVNFGALFTTNHAYTPWSQESPHLLLGALWWPQPIRLYWLTIHPHRGLFYACPVLALAFLFPWGEPRWRQILRDHLVPLGVIAYFLLFNMSFYGWTGGWGVGPRYLMPSIPFVFVLATFAARRWPKVAAVLALVSVSNMFTVAAVCLMVPAKDGGPPMHLDPIVECYRRLYSWQTIAMHHGSFNLGLKMGMPGLTSLLPPLAVMLACFGLALRQRAGRPALQQVTADVRAMP